MANWVNIGTMSKADCKVGDIVSLDGKQYRVQALSADGKSCRLTVHKEPPLEIEVRPSRVQPNNQTPPGPIGNTNGMIVPDTAPNPTGNPAPPVKPKKEEKGWWKRWGSDA